MFHRACFLGLALVVGAARLAGADYLRDIKPLLGRQCVGCHGPTARKGGLQLDTAAAVRQGGRHGPAIQPGRPAESLLLAVVEGRHPEIDRMPYQRPPLESDPVALLRAWIAAGAPAPADEAPTPDRHWAFVRPEFPPVPPGGGHPVDAFLDQRLREHGLAPAAEADPATLLRRVSLDLTGLPPRPEELAAWLADPAPGRYERWVDRLLASPHHGERWARWWLDAARYADSNGYSIDGPRSVWPYRDWVVRAFNADLPFDTFTRWQIAGDLWPGDGVEAVIASGFHRHTQINHEGGIDPEQFRLEAVVDRVNTTSTVWLGVTVGCAQCHDHKFDPFTQRDYYGLFAFFNSTANDGHADSGYAATGPDLELPEPGQREALRAWEADLARLEARAADAGVDAAERGRRQKAVNEHRKRRPAVTRTLVMRELPEPRETVVFLKGDFTRPGPRVRPATPPALAPATREPRDRRDLADWVVSPANPLAARVAVNRIWQVYFGRGLVETENDFGTMGAEPSHPELLDWLACVFRDQGWSMKRIHRLIVTSAAYRRSSRASPEQVARDPRNRWLSRQNRLRLEAEQVRDVALAVSGRLDARLGGPPVFPPQPAGLGAFTQNQREWPTSQGGDRFRRALYTHLQRSTLHPAFGVFDAPDTFTTCTRRQRSNTPLQALTLLNDAAFHELAGALATRLQAAGPGLAARLRDGFRLVTGREPAPAELAALGRLWEAERAAQVPESGAWLSVARVLLNLDETITRE